MAQKQATTHFGTYHIADTPAAYQPQRTNHFRFLVQGLDNLLRVGGIESDRNDYITNGQEVLDFSVVSFNPPHFTLSDIQVQRGNSTVYFAGKPQFGDDPLMINDFIGADGKSVLYAWQALAYDVVNDTVASSDKYKKDCLVFEYTPDNVLVRYWELKGCWVKAISETGWNNEQANKKTVQATIRYDRAIMHMPDEL